MTIEEIIKKYFASCNDNFCYHVKNDLNALTQSVKNDTIREIVGFIDKIFYDPEEDFDYCVESLKMNLNE